MKVIVFGAGISGLTVAHELVKKGFSVEIYEKDILGGGMAKSIRNKDNVPTEHSWRGYGPHYHNFFRLAKEIPLSNNKNKSDFQSICCSATSTKLIQYIIIIYYYDKLIVHICHNLYLKFHKYMYDNF